MFHSHRNVVDARHVIFFSPRLLVELLAGPEDVRGRNKIRRADSASSPERKEDKDIFGPLLQGLTEPKSTGRSLLNGPCHGVK
jgi:hypothetical protein